MHHNSKIYVAGHRGLLGSALVRQLQSQGYINILTVTRQELDLANQTAVAAWFEQNKPQYVFLAAAQLFGINANVSGDVILNNLQIQINVIDAARRNGCVKLLFPGSNTMYPKFPQLPITEDQLLTGPLEPTSESYATAKIAGFMMCKHFRKQWGFDAITVIPCNLYGPNDRYDLEHAGVMAAMINKFVTAKQINQDAITLWGDSSVLREFLYADDVADAVILCMKEYNSEEPINIASGEEVALRHLADMIKLATGYTGSIIWDNTKPAGTPAKGLDITKLTKMGWQQQYPLSRGISLAVDGFRKLA